MLGEVVNSRGPAIQYVTTETTSRADGRCCHTPSVHRAWQKLDVMHEFEVLPEVVFSVECSLLPGSFGAAREVVRLDVGVVWVCLATKYTTQKPGCGVHNFGPVR